MDIKFTLTDEQEKIVREQATQRMMTGMDTKIIKTKLINEYDIQEVLEIIEEVLTKHCEKFEEEKLGNLNNYDIVGYTICKLIRNM